MADCGSCRVTVCHGLSPTAAAVTAARAGPGRRRAQCCHGLRVTGGHGHRSSKLRLPEAGPGPGRRGDSGRARDWPPGPLASQGSLALMMIPATRLGLPCPALARTGRPLTEAGHGHAAGPSPGPAAGIWRPHSGWPAAAESQVSSHESRVRVTLFKQYHNHSKQRPPGPGPAGRLTRDRDSMPVSQAGAGRAARWRRPPWPGFHHDH